MFKLNLFLLIFFATACTQSENPRRMILNYDCSKADQEKMQKLYALCNKTQYMSDTCWRQATISFCEFKCVEYCEEKQPK